MRLQSRGPVSNLVFSIFFSQMATVFLSGNGLKVTVEDCKCVQANAFVQANIFQEFSFSKDSATFKINLNVLMVRTIDEVLRPGNSVRVYVRACVCVHASGVRILYIC